MIRMDDIKTIKIALIDDEKPARSLLKKFLERYSDIKLIGEASDGFEGIKLINSLQPDIVFLDIRMPKIDGFEMLELIEKQPIIIFSTAYNEFALKAFERNAVDYLLKPFSRQRFDAALQKAIEKWQNSQLRKLEAKNLQSLQTEKKDKLNRIVVKQNSKIIVIPCDEITHFEAQDDYVFVYTQNNRYLKHTRMNYLQQNLNPKDFVRIHRSFITNINFIDKIELLEKKSYCLILKNSSVLKVSKAGYKLLKQKLGI